jgi:hypothetical protein
MATKLRFVNHCTQSMVIPTGHLSHDPNCFVDLVRHSEDRTNQNHHGLYRMEFVLSIAFPVAAQSTAPTPKSLAQDDTTTPPSSETTSTSTFLLALVGRVPELKILSIRVSRSQTISRSPSDWIFLKYRMRCCGIHSSSVGSEIQFRTGISLIPANRSR